MSDLDLTLGVDAPIILPVNGKELKLATMTKGVQQDFATWLEMLARKKVYAIEGEVSEEIFVKMLLEIGDKSNLGYYRFFGEHAREMISRRDGAGARKLFHLMLLYHQPKTTEEEAFQIFDEHTVAVTQAVQQMMDRGKNAASPATAAS